MEKAYKVIRELFIFTNKRLILLDKQGVTGRKMWVPFRSLSKHHALQY
ncbi:hypothetical protein ACVKN2_003485 [Paenibacillus sp. PvR018]